MIFVINGHYKLEGLISVLDKRTWLNVTLEQALKAPYLSIIVPFPIMARPFHWVWRRLHGMDDGIYDRPDPILQQMSVGEKLMAYNYTRYFNIPLTSTTMMVWLASLLPFRLGEDPSTIEPAVKTVVTALSNANLIDLSATFSDYEVEYMKMFPGKAPPRFLVKNRISGDQLLELEDTPKISVILRNPITGLMEYKKVLSTQKRTPMMYGLGIEMQFVLSLKVRYTRSPGDIDLDRIKGKYFYSIHHENRTERIEIEEPLFFIGSMAPERRGIKDSKDNQVVKYSYQKALNTQHLPTVPITSNVETSSFVADNGTIFGYWDIITARSPYFALIPASDRKDMFPITSINNEMLYVWNWMNGLESGWKDITDPFKVWDYIDYFHLPTATMFFSDYLTLLLNWIVGRSDRGALKELFIERLMKIRPEERRRMMIMHSMNDSDVNLPSFMLGKMIV